MQIQRVRFELPDHVSIVSDEFDGEQISITYDSNYGGTVTVDGTAEIDEGRYPSDWAHLVVDGRKFRSNGHVFSAEDDRHLGTVESVTVTAPHDVAVELITEQMDCDIDRKDEDNVTIIQGWDKGVIDQEGFMAGTIEVHLEHL